jgi:hypothetical protein
MHAPSRRSIRRSTLGPDSAFPQWWSQKIALLALILTLWGGIVHADNVGSTAGDGFVTPTGEAQYRIPLVLPPGINGLTPELALTYRHRFGNGLLGVGWSLEGLSAIYRCAQTLAQDGTTNPIALEPTDRLCLDGNRLRLTGGTQGLTGSTYRTELEVFGRVTANGSGGQPPISFKVEGKDGLYYFYGTTANSRIQSQGSTAVRVWALSRVEDRSGNYFTVTYD